MLQIKIIVGLLVLLAFAGMAYTITVLRHDKADLKAEVSTLRDNLEATVRVNTAQREAILKNQKSERENHAQQTTLRDQAIKASPADDGPVAPVLTRALDGLHGSAE